MSAISHRRSRPPLKLYRRLLRYVRPYKAVFGFAIVGMLLVASTDVMMLQIIQPLLNNIGPATAESTKYLPLMIVGVFVLRGIGSYVSEYGLAWIGSRVVFDLRCEASDHLLRLPTPFYDASSAGLLLSKVTYDAQQVASAASEAITVGDPQHADDRVHAGLPAVHELVAHADRVRRVPAGRHAICARSTSG